MDAGPPQTFRDLKNLVRIHLKQILKLDKITSKLPMHAVALLVVIAYEALSKYLYPRKGPEFLFAQEHLQRHGLPVSIGGAIFDALRNGLAHTYAPYPIVVEGIGEIRLELTWKDGAAAHLRGVLVQMVNGHQRFSAFPKAKTEVPRAVCLNVESMWHDLDAVFALYETSLTGDVALAARFEGNVKRNRAAYMRTAVGDVACQWRDFLSVRKMVQTQ